MATRDKKNKYRRGFTLIELMGVILLIALLLTISMAAVSQLLKSARAKRIDIMKRTLENVITRYHEDYGQWPGLEPDEQSGKTLKKGDWRRGVFELNTGPKALWNDAGIMFGKSQVGQSLDGGNNYKILNSLLLRNNANTKNVTYLDETGFSVWDGAKQEVVKISDWAGGDAHWVFRDVDGKDKKFSVLVLPIDRKVTVETGDNI